MPGDSVIGPGPPACHNFKLNFGLWRVCFPPCLVRPGGPAGDCPCKD